MENGLLSQTPIHLFFIVIFPQLWIFAYPHKWMILSWLCPCLQWYLVAGIQQSNYSIHWRILSLISSEFAAFPYHWLSSCPCIIRKASVFLCYISHNFCSISQFIFPQLIPRWRQWWSLGLRKTMGFWECCAQADKGRSYHHGEHVI